MKLKVTFGVCVRNCEKDVPKIIGRIMSQDFPHEYMEVIFVEDGSKDNTLYSIISHAPKMDIQYRIYSHKSNGLGQARNIVLKNARGEYILWLDDGTIIPIDYVSKHIAFMEEHDTVGIARGYPIIYKGVNQISALENMSQLAFYNNCSGRITKRLPATGASIYRVESARQVGGFNESIKGATEDVDIAYRMMQAGWQVYITEVGFSTEYNKKLKDVWTKNVWYGYGAHFTLHKHKHLNELLYKGTPFAGFLQGILEFSCAYKLTCRRSAVLLPFFISMKRVAFCYGFMKSHFESYGH